MKIKVYLDVITEFFRDAWRKAWYSKAFIIFVLMILGMNLIAMTTFFQGKTVYSGKFVDADTLEPLEGVVVAISWDKVGGYSGFTKLCGVKETLTDKNGEWSLEGPIRRRNWRSHSSFWDLISYVKYVAGRIHIAYFKPGYQRGWYFEAYPHHIDYEYQTDEDGIIFNLTGGKYYGLSHLNQPFIPMKNPEKILKTMAFDFTYSHTVKPVKIDFESGKEERYTVRGLKKAVTMEEIRSLIGASAPGGKTKTPIMYQMIQDAEKKIHLILAKESNEQEKILREKRLKSRKENQFQHRGQNE